MLEVRSRPQAGADCVLSTSVDGFTVTTPLEALTDDRDALFAFAMNGEPLPVEHGFPVRHGRPRPVRLRLGDEVGRRPQGDQVRRRDRLLDQPRLVGAGTDQDRLADRRAEELRPGVQGHRRRSPGWPGRSTAGSPVSRSRSTTASGRTPRCRARSAPIPGGNGCYQWDTTATGQHTIRCRAIDGTGTVQTDQIQGVMPDGATGWDSRSVTVTA